MSEAKPGVLTPSEERTWAMAAHLSVLANLVTGYLGVAGPLIIYIIYKDRSRYVAFQAWQAFLFQLIWWVGGSFLAATAWVITGTLSAVLVGLVCIPLACIVTVMPMAALVYGIIGGVRCNAGDDFRYWLVADLAQSTLPKQA